MQERKINLSFKKGLQIAKSKMIQNIEHDFGKKRHRKS
jgi:hypothetical protein